MAASLANINLSATGILSKADSPTVSRARTQLFLPLRAASGGGLRGSRISNVRPVLSSPATPSEISEKVEESIKKAEEQCAGDASSGECAAAWDEVEELAAAASHARDKLKENSDPLENYCKENPETDECRTYE